MKKTFVCLFILTTLNALNMSMIFYCDDYCTTIKVEDKIIYNEGYKSQGEQATLVFFYFQNLK